MTRYTNFSRKRTYEQASLNYRENDPADPATPNTQESPSENRESKRSRKSQDQPKDSQSSGEANVSSSTLDAQQEASTSSQPENAPSESQVNKPARKKTHRAGKRVKDEAARRLASERRRLKRKNGREIDTVCYACREQGHAARDCTRAVGAAADTSSNRGSKQTGKKAVGLCYRCGSRKHNLSRCNELEDPSNPFPFASCFVCSGRGHLASSCPQNASKGIYPNGGCCKLCGETTHLAKDCQLRKKDAVTSNTVLLGTGHEAGPDEDDFHTLKRNTVALDKAEKKEQQTKKRINVQIGAHSGTLKSFGKPPVNMAKKVIFF